MKGHITYIEFNSQDVYIEFGNDDSEIVSYTKAKKLLNEATAPIRYFSNGSQRACDFTNSISRKKFSVKENIIEPRQGRKS